MLVSMKLPRAILAAVLFCVSLIATAAWADIAVPPLKSRVTDLTATLNAGQRAALESKLADFEQKKGSQFAVLLVPTTQPEDIAAYAQRVGDTWKIGRKDVGDGLLLVVAKQDRRIRIEVAKAVEQERQTLRAQMASLDARHADQRAQLQTITLQLRDLNKRHQQLLAAQQPSLRSLFAEYESGSER